MGQRKFNILCSYQNVNGNDDLHTNTPTMVLTRAPGSRRIADDCFQRISATPRILGAQIKLGMIGGGNILF